MSTVATIHVLAGVNGAGKSIVGEAIFKVANAHGWQIGKALLENAITGGRDFRFETTLGGNTIPALLEMREGKITAPADLSGAPDWAQPIIAAAIHLHTGKPPH